MIVVSRPLYRALWWLVLVATVFTGAVERKRVPTPPPAPAPAPAPAHTTVTLSAIRLPSTRADASTLSWTSNQRHAAHHRP